MEKDRLSRKLAVILHADVVGSTSLVQIDETLAHQRIRAVFNNFSEAIGAYGGLTHEIRGDALIAEFARASDAVAAAIAFQTTNSVHVQELPDQIRPMLRVGIAMGEVVVADKTVTGEGIVLAQRLEQLAEPGCVVVQGSVSETVPTRLPFVYKNLGEQKLKGFDQPIRAFGATLKSGEKPPAPEEEVSGKGNESSGLKIPNVPSIAVLPFTNMSNDPEQEFFSDGICEEIITALSKITAIMVVARNSTFIYKGKAVDIKQVGREQGVRYVLEGSVRKSGERVRITAQLIDSITGNHLWAERYDRKLEDIFELQDEITQKVVNALDIKLVSGEQAKLWAGGTDNLEAWECVRISQDLLSGYRTEDRPEAQRLLHRAIELDPEYAFAWALLAGCNLHIADDQGLSIEERHKSLGLTRECAEKALELDPTCSKAHAQLGLYYLNLGEYDAAEQNAYQAAELSPNLANDQALAAIIVNKCGNPESALTQIQKAMRLSPVHPIWFLTALGQILRVLKRYDESVDVFSEMIKRDPEHFEGFVCLAEILGEVGRLDEAKEAAAQVLRTKPDFSISDYIRNLSYRDPEQISRFQEGLRNAGLPE